MPNESAELMPSAAQWPHAAIVVVTAIVAIGAIAAVAMLHYKAPGDAVTVLGPVIAVISSLVAAYFGVRSGSMAMQKANEAEAIRKQPET